jgi:hypothetical protein
MYQMGALKNRPLNEAHLIRSTAPKQREPPLTNCTQCLRVFFLTVRFSLKQGGQVAGTINYLPNTITAVPGWSFL